MHNGPLQVGFQIGHKNLLATKEKYKEFILAGS